MLTIALMTILLWLLFHRNGRIVLLALFCGIAALVFTRRQKSRRGTSGRYR